MFKPSASAFWPLAFAFDLQPSAFSLGRAAVAKCPLSFVSRRLAFSRARLAFGCWLVAAPCCYLAFASQLCLSVFALWPLACGVRPLVFGRWPLGFRRLPFVLVVALVLVIVLVGALVPLTLCWHGVGKRNKESEGARSQQGRSQQRLVAGVLQRVCKHRWSGIDHKTEQSLCRG